MLLIVVNIAHDALLNLQGHSVMLKEIYRLRNLT